jgi:hypothetical protein
MAVIAKALDYDAERVTLTLEACADTVAIPNTTTAGAVSAPVDADITAVAKAASLAAENYSNMPVYPKGYANVVQVTVAGSPSDGDAAETLIYCYVSTNSGATPADADYQLVGEVASGQTAFYMLAIGNDTGSSYIWTKAKFRNADRVSSTFGPLEPAGAKYTVGTADNHTQRGRRMEIRQIAGDKFIGNNYVMNNHI